MIREKSRIPMQQALWLRISQLPLPKWRTQHLQLPGSCRKMALAANSLWRLPGLKKQPGPNQTHSSFDRQPGSDGWSSWECEGLTPGPAPAGLEDHPAPEPSVGLAKASSGTAWPSTLLCPHHTDPRSVPDKTPALHLRL